MFEISHKTSGQLTDLGRYDILPSPTLSLLTSLYQFDIKSLVWSGRTSEKKQIKRQDLSVRIENPVPLASLPGHKVMKMQLAGD